MISFKEFKKLEIKVAQIKEAKEHPDADRLLILKIDIGGEEKQVVAGIREHYKVDELIGKKVIALVNLEPASIRGIESSGMVLASIAEDSLALLVPEKDIPIGTKIS